MTPRIALVVALARNGVIGRDNGLAWHLSSDLKRFKALTLGKTMLMGRKTWDSIGRPLPGRRSLVLTRDPGFRAAGAEVVHDWAHALAAAVAGEMGAGEMGAGEMGVDEPGGGELMVVGGAQIYALALPHADRLHLTEVDAAPDGDVRFPDFDRAAFRETFREAHPDGPRDAHAFAFVDLERRR